MSETVKLLYQAFSSNRPDLLDQVLAPEWEDIPLNPGQKAGRDSIKPMIGGFNQTISGLKITNDDIIEAGDKVVKTWHIEDWLSGLFQMGSFEK
jgi:hypothetical protein